MRYFYSVLLFLIFSCKPQETTLTAQQIIDKTIVLSGADKIKNSEVSFKFRNREYAALRENGKFQLMRSFDSIQDILDNTGFKRLILGQTINVADSMAFKYRNSINSVHYFSVLPFGLNDKAVRKKLLPSSTIKEKEYYKVEITFSENGGGEDFEDVFIYWIGKENFLVDYLAYSYHINGGGKRFRVLKEQCSRNGIRFVDYQNFKPLDAKIKLSNLDSAFENKQLKKISEIILEDIQVKILD
ncbi:MULTISPECIES: DUF6503 family protein [unclassified Polaribacter]|uniref:DUF6503 family protein n=1 Tax=unclassified Polaribacter TaxID=196858 RepID=UPI0011BF379E|nr:MULTISPECIES: DUF6503 family protein [unclassified Polaribacter]TXD51748.1 deoxyribose-phosphate aldolase [Polaribacter sp. IC063]TXD58959.1 deoxyribose-phosphate aldolase [Polaribacter sp. IC066]